MERVFRYRVGIRNTGWACLIGFIAMAIISVFGALDAPADRRWIAFIVFEGFSFCWIGMAIWMLMAFYKESLHLLTDRIVRQGVTNFRSIEFKNVTDLKWRMWPVGGSVVLKSDDRRMAFDLQNFEAADRVTLIRSLRAAVPAAIQRGWPEFCERWAVSLLDLDENRPLREGEVRITRARFDAYFLPAIGVAAMLGPFVAWNLTEGRFLFLPIPLILIWLPLRMMLPRQGRIVRRLSSQPGTMQYSLFAAATAILAVGATVWIDKHPTTFRHPLIAMAIVLGLALTAMCIGGTVLDRRRKLDPKSKSTDAVRRWESAVQIEQPIID